MVFAAENDQGRAPRAGQKTALVDQELLQVQEEVYVPTRTVNLQQVQKETLEEVLNERNESEEGADGAHNSN